MLGYVLVNIIEQSLLNYYFLLNLCHFSGTIARKTNERTNNPRTNMLNASEMPLWSKIVEGPENSVIGIFWELFSQQAERFRKN